MVHARVVELLKHLNENPDLLHYDITPAVYELVSLGRPALRYGVLEALLSPDYDTRQRAENVVDRIVLTELGYFDTHRSLAERQWADEQGKKIWLANGNYDCGAPEELRRASYEKWVLWLHRTDSDLH